MALCEVDCLRNSLLPINRLPPEIVTLCAAFVSRTDPKPVISLTHICRYWRGAITSNPGSWTLIGSDWKKLAPLCLERSGATPLTANISVPDIQKEEDLIRALIPHVPRISHLSLTGYTSVKDVADILPGFFTSPMLNLITLKLDQDKESAHSFPSSQVHLPPLLQNVSKLKSLHLTRIPLYPILFSVESLVDLTLIDYKLPFQKFVGFLESNLNLVVVELFIEFSRAPTPATPERVVSLPRLRRLVFTCNKPIDARALISSLSLPRGINIEVHGSLRNSCSDFTSFLPCPSTHIQGLFAPITTIKYLHSPGRFHLSGNGGSLSFHNYTAPHSLYEALDLFATGTVREFHLPCTSEHCTHLSWALERLPALEVLVVYKGRPGPTFLSALAKEPVLSPSLNTIAFLECDMTSGIVPGLEEVAAKRKHSTAARLHRVVIVDHMRDLPSYHLISELQKSVPRVDVIFGHELPDLL